MGQYHSLYPLDKDNSKSVEVFGYISHIFKCTSTNDRMPYVLRRIDGFHVADEAALNAADAWKAIHHPNIITLNEVAVTSEFSDKCKYIQ